MNAPQLPAYLQNRKSQGVAARATAGMGSVLPPRISIRGNSFTLIDQAGAEMPAGPVIDACVADISDHMCKRYYENDWTPGSDEPPTCFSRNGVGPSRDSTKPQARTCGECQWNVRGSDTSRISGKPIKACRDEKEVALILPAYTGMLFQLVIPPGSFKNWTAFTQPFAQGGTDISDVLVRFGFQPGVNGVMTFQAVSYITEDMFAAREKALETKATDVLVGRTDVPIAALPAPQHPYAGDTITVQPQEPGATATITGALGVPQGSFQPQPAPQTQGFGGSGFVPSAAPSGPVPTSAPVAGTTPPSEQPARRRRRTREEIAADNAAKAAVQAPPSPMAGQPPAPQAPFPVSNNGGFGAPAQQPAQQAQPGFGSGQAPAGFGAPATTAAAPAQFGIADPAQPDPQLAAMLASLNTGQ